MNVLNRVNKHAKRGRKEIKKQTKKTKREAKQICLFSTPLTRLNGESAKERKLIYFAFAFSSPSSWHFLLEFCGCSLSSCVDFLQERLQCPKFGFIQIQTNGQAQNLRPDVSAKHFIS